MFANESYNGVVVEGILLEYGGSSSGGQFLSGLEKTEYGSFDQFAVLLQYEQGSEQAGSVDVVSAGVHYARMDRRERNARILLNGKGIRIGPQHDTPFRIARPVIRARRPVPAIRWNGIPASVSRSAR